MLAATGNITDLMFGFVSHVAVPYRTSHPHLLVACEFSFTACDNVFSMDASNNEAGQREREREEKKKASAMIESFVFALHRENGGRLRMC